MPPKCPITLQMPPPTTSGKPHWIVRANGLAGMLAFSLFANQIRLDAIEDSGFQDI